jgi:hypothetical protein
MFRNIKNGVLIPFVAIFVFATATLASQVAAAGLPGARSATSGDVFLGGNYIELGIRTNGKFGSASNKPAGFFGSPARQPIGMVADFDGFDVGNDSRIDYFMPGSPEERWVVGYMIGATKTTASNFGTAIQDLTVGNDLKAKVTGTSGAVDAELTISFNVNDKFFKTAVRLTNNSGQTLDSLRFMRSFDPDNTVDKGGSYDTRNEVLYTIAEDGKAAVSARTHSDTDPVFVMTGSRAPILYYSDDVRARASTFGFANSDPYAPAAYDTPAAKNAAVVADQAITLAFNFDAVEPGQSVTFNYYTSLDDRDFDEVITSIQQAEAPSPTPTAVPTAPVATTVPTSTPSTTPKPQTVKYIPLKLVENTQSTPTPEPSATPAIPTMSATPTQKIVEEAIPTEPIRLQIVDADNKPLVGAVVKIDGDPNQYTTDSQGFITLKKEFDREVEVTVSLNGKVEKKKVYLSPSAGGSKKLEIQLTEKNETRQFPWVLISCIVLPACLFLFLLIKRRKKDEEEQKKSIQADR